MQGKKKDKKEEAALFKGGDDDNADEDDDGGSPALVSVLRKRICFVLFEMVSSCARSYGVVDPVQGALLQT